MRRQGENVLEALCRLTANDVVLFGMTARAVADDLGYTDGRSVTPALQRLERAALVRAIEKHRKLRWKPTPRGRDLDRLLAAASHERGGTFRPSREFTSISERLAIK